MTTSLERIVSIVPSSAELLEEIRRKGRKRMFEEMLGPEPCRGDAAELEVFLSFLEEQRRESKSPERKKAE